MHAGTHDVQHLMIRRGHLSTHAISITCTYLPGSVSAGFFAVVSSMMNQSDVIYIVADRDQLSQSQASVGVHNQFAYSVVVYDRGENFLPEIWPAGREIVPPAISLNGSPSYGVPLMRKIKY